jgi:hypothetical protein
MIRVVNIAPNPTSKVQLIVSQDRDICDLQILDGIGYQIFVASFADSNGDGMVIFAVSSTA